MHCTGESAWRRRTRLSAGRSELRLWVEAGDTTRAQKVEASPPAHQDSTHRCLHAPEKEKSCATTHDFEMKAAPGCGGEGSGCGDEDVLVAQIVEFVLVV